MVGRMVVVLVDKKVAKKVELLVALKVDKRVG